MANVVYRNVKAPECDCTGIPVILTDKTIEERIEKVYAAMKKENYETLVIYADLEHGNNFEYLGSYTRTNLTIESVDYYVYTLTKPTTISGFKQTFA